MHVTHKLQIDLACKGYPPIVDAVKGDRFVRKLCLQLMEGSTPWMIPKNAMALIAYRKPDGMGGQYDTLPDGSSAVKIQGNTITIDLAPQVLNIPGRVQLAVRFLQGQKEISTFVILVNVQGLPEGYLDSEDYFNIQSFLPQPAAAAQLGQLLAVSGVDTAGKITALVPVNGSQAGGGGYYRPKVEQSDPSMITLDFYPSNAGMGGALGFPIMLPAGPAGADGKDGAAGKSAYEVAVDNGFQGQEQDWLESLNGNDGVGIQSVEQTATSTDGGGNNQMKITLTDGRTSYMNVRNGKDGTDGKSAYQSYVDSGGTLSEAEWVASIVQPGAPLFASSVEEMTDTSKVYVGPNGNLYAYMESTGIQEVEETFERTTDANHENPYVYGRLSDTGGITSSGRCITTPWIDIGPYIGTIKLKFGGLPWIPQNAAGTYNRMALYDENKALINCYDSYGAVGNDLLWGSNVTWDGIDATVTWNLPKISGNKTVRYVRVGIRDTSISSGDVDVTKCNVSIVHTEKVSLTQWMDTGIPYAPALTDADKQAIAQEAAALVDAQLLSVIGSGEVTV